MVAFRWRDLAVCVLFYCSAELGRDGLFQVTPCAENVFEPFLLLLLLKSI